MGLDFRERESLGIFMVYRKELFFFFFFKLLFMYVCIYICSVVCICL